MLSVQTFDWYFCGEEVEQSGGSAGPTRTAVVRLLVAPTPSSTAYSQNAELVIFQTTKLRNEMFVKLFIYMCMYRYINIHTQGFIQALWVPNISPFTKANRTENSQFLGYKFTNWLIYIFLIMSVRINKFNKVNNFSIITK